MGEQQEERSQEATPDTQQERILVGRVDREQLHPEQDFPFPLALVLRIRLPMQAIQETRFPSLGQEEPLE